MSLSFESALIITVSSSCTLAVSATATGLSFTGFTVIDTVAESEPLFPSETVYVTVAAPL